MLKLLLRRIAAVMVGAALGAAAAGVATVAAGFALYAVLAPRLGEAAAAAITAAGFAILAGLVAVLIPIIWRRRPPSTARAREEAETVGTATELLIAAAGAALGLFRRSRRAARDQPGDSRSRRRGRKG